MSEDFGATFITITDEDGNEHVIEYIASVEYNGQEYRAFFPVETEDEDLEEDDAGLILLKVIEEGGEELLSTCDSEEEAEAVFELFLEVLEEDEED